jgi:hypothetical protein
VDYYLQDEIIEGFNWFGLGSSKKKVTAKPTTKTTTKPTVKPTTMPPIPTASPDTPKFITNYVSQIITNKYLSNTNIQSIYSAAKYANNVPPVKTKQNLIDYLKVLQKQLNEPQVPPIPQLVYFCISIPRAFKLFYFPEDTIPVPYNKLHETMSDIFPTCKEYTQIQMMCIYWQQSMLLLTPSGTIMDPRNDIFIQVINNYIENINISIDKLQVLYASSIYE